MPEVVAEEAGVTTYQVNARASRFTVQAFAEGLFSAFGHNPKLNATDFSGEIRFHPDDLRTAALQFKVKADSLQVVDKISDQDKQEITRMMLDQVLEATRFPEIAFVSKAVVATRIYEGFYRVTIDGQLTLHGVTRDHVIETQLRLLENGLRAEGESRLRQTNHGIKLVSVAAGTLKVKDEVKLSFDIVAGRP